MVGVEIKFKDRSKALRFARHVEKTHPSTRGRVEVEDSCKPKRIRVTGTKKFIDEMLTNSPNFLREAREVTRLQW